MPIHMTLTKSSWRGSRKQSFRTPAMSSCVGPLVPKSTRGELNRATSVQWAKLARETPEWWGKTDDTWPPPDRVRDRIVARASNCCQICGNRVRTRGQVDHIVAIINGGENRENNLQFLCQPCHTAKTGKDVAEKATNYRKRKKLGPLQKKPSRLAQQWAWKKKILAEREET